MAYDYKRYFDEIAVIRDLTNMPGEARWHTAAPAKDERHSIVLYLGCNVFRTSHMIHTITAIFDRLGLDYVAVGGPSYCCGIVHHQQGDTDAARGMSQGTIRLFERFSPREVVMWCPSCIYFYDEVQHLRLQFTQEVRQRVALHYHVQNGSRRREGAAGRALLEAVPGLTFVPVEPEPRFGRICTAGVQQQLGLEAWNGLVRDEIARAHAAGADTLATIYHGCQRLICGFEAQAPLTVEHYLSVFARGLGIEFEDTYKRWMLSGDPEAIMADATPCMEANGVEPATARAFVERTFVALSGSSPARDGAVPS